MSIEWIMAVLIVALAIWNFYLSATRYRIEDLEATVDPEIQRMYVEIFASISDVARALKKEVLAGSDKERTAKVLTILAEQAEIFKASTANMT